MQKTIFDRIGGRTGRTGGRTGEPAVEPMVEPVVKPTSFHIFFFKLKRCHFDAFYIEMMSFYLELESL